MSQFSTGVEQGATRLLNHLKCNLDKDAWHKVFHQFLTFNPYQESYHGSKPQINAVREPERAVGEYV